jgi:hypothetical protein
MCSIISPCHKYALEELLDLWHIGLLIQQATTASSSIFNATYFLRYRSSRRGRRWGALVLLLVNVAFLTHAVYLTLLTAQGSEALFSLVTSPRFVATVGVFSQLPSLLITLLVLRRKRRKHGPA